MPNALKLVLKIVGWAAGIAATLILILVVFIQLRWNASDGRATPVLTAPRDSSAIARGEYIFKYQALCWECHESPAKGPDNPPNGGRLFDLTNIGPGFGKWYALNLTPDNQTGLGSWTDGEIVQAIREGVAKDRSPLFPIMPFEWYHGMADSDALALVAYLRSLPPVSNVVPDQEPSFIAKALFAFKVTKPKEPVTAPVLAPPPGITPEYGQYVSSHLGGCAECHTPRNLQNGAFYYDSLFAGSSYAFGGGPDEPILSFARNITADKETGIGSWTEDQFLTAVTAGVTPDGIVLNPEMPYAYYKSWSTDDLRAIYAYLKTIPAIKRTVPPTAWDPQVPVASGAEHGRQLFTARCEPCHGENGEGAEPTHVRLAEVAPSVGDTDLTTFISSGDVGLKMPTFGKTLTKEETAEVISFIRSWEKK